MTILLASTKAAGQGLNLTAASRAFIMEPMWNPAAEAQAVDRIYRIGQKREVFIKRYQIEDSIEEKIVQLARKKQDLAKKAMDRTKEMKMSKTKQREEKMKDIVALFN
jgi:SNF2 family DNA or RNA helicase